MWFAFSQNGQIVCAFPEKPQCEAYVAGCGLQNVTYARFATQA